MAIEETFTLEQLLNLSYLEKLRRFFPEEMCQEIINPNLCPLPNIIIPIPEEKPQVLYHISEDKVKCLYTGHPLANIIIPVPEEKLPVLYHISEENRVEPYITSKIAPPSDIARLCWLRKEKDKLT